MVSKCISLISLKSPVMSTYIVASSLNYDAGLMDLLPYEVIQVMIIPITTIFITIVT
jgi:hypothetical protein